MEYNRKKINKARNWLAENRPEIDLNRITGWDIYIVYLREIGKDNKKNKDALKEQEEDNDIVIDRWF